MKIDSVKSAYSRKGLISEDAKTEYVFLFSYIKYVKKVIGIR